MNTDTYRTDRRKEITMDIFQILVTYNKPWTVYEVKVFGLVLILVFLEGWKFLKKGKIGVSQFVAVLLMWCFLAVVYASTVFTRNPGTRQYELELFWSWKAVFHGSREMLKENILNVFLIMPVGLILPYICNRKLKWYTGLIAGIIVSFSIESLQLIMRRGLFEIDDIIHNSLGCMTGLLICQKLMGRKRRWNA